MQGSNMVSCDPNYTQHLESLGCWADEPDRAISGVDNGFKNARAPRRESLPFRKCADYCKTLGSTVFSLQDGKQCFLCGRCSEGYQKYGPERRLQYTVHRQRRGKLWWDMG